MPPPHKSRGACPSSSSDDSMAPKKPPPLFGGAGDVPPEKTGHQRVETIHVFAQDSVRAKLETRCHDVGVVARRWQLFFRASPVP